MSRIFLSALLGVSLLGSGAAFAQSPVTAPGNSSDNGVNPKMQNKITPAGQPGMAATSPESNNAAAGAGKTENGGTTQGKSDARPDNAGAQTKTD